MSRIGNAPIPVPSGVDISLSGSTITVKGPKGTLSRDLPEGISFTQENDVLSAVRESDQRELRALHGLCRSLVANMVEGVTDGFVKELEIRGVGYRAIPKGSKSIELSLGFSHTVIVDAPEGIEFEVPIATQIKVIGIDKQLVGQTAANIRKFRKPEPYKGKGIRYVGEHVVRKAGKASK